MSDETEKEMTSQDYFDYIKSKTNSISSEYLDKFYQTIQNELAKAMITKQNILVRRLAFMSGVIPKEKELVDLGITTYVHMDDITDYIENVADKSVQIVDISEYPRAIPNEIAKSIKLLTDKKIFDTFYIVFTDYTGEITKNIEVERRNYDPIIFGSFEQKIDNLWEIHDRMYYIGDWEDEYCDLTLSKMLNEMTNAGKSDIQHSICIPKPTEDEVRNYLNTIAKPTNIYFNIDNINNKKKSFFKNIISKVKNIFN